ncbi:hypothetical protein STEG23_017788, partial [Scotinomys teguina]
RSKFAVMCSENWWHSANTYGLKQSTTLSVTAKNKNGFPKMGDSIDKMLALQSQGRAVLENTYDAFSVPPPPSLPCPSMCTYMLVSHIPSFVPLEEMQVFAYLPPLDFILQGAAEQNRTPLWSTCKDTVKSINSVGGVDWFCPHSVIGFIVSPLGCDLVLVNPFNKHELIGVTCTIKGDLLLNSFGKIETVGPSGEREIDGHDKVDQYTNYSDLNYVEVHLLYHFENTEKQF